MTSSSAANPGAPAGTASLPRTPPRDRYGRDTTAHVEAIVEMGRAVIDCPHSYNTWCSCKVRDLVGRMIIEGWQPPEDHS